MITENEHSTEIEVHETGAVETHDQTTAALLARLDAASDIHAESLRPKNTTRGYASDWKAWRAFIAETNQSLAGPAGATLAEKLGLDDGAELSLPVTAATRGTLRAFVAWLWKKGAAPSTVDRRLAGVAVTLRREHQVTVNPDDTKAAREMLKDYVRQGAESREAPRGRGQAAPLLLPDLRKISAACPDSPTGIRDRALVLLAFAIAGRRSEVAGLMARDIAEDQNGLVVDVRVSKTKPRIVAVPYGSNPLTCPVRAWRAWREAAALEDDGPAFRAIDRHGRLGGELSGQAAGDVVTRAGKRAGVETKLTGHSARAGLATEARRAGKDRKAIAATTGHVPNSAVLDRYMRTVDQWSDEDNALMGIGL
jgi:integrase